jgi:two-component system chemotaxis sensor kinase CheA
VAQTVRVEIGKLDSLMDAVGELLRVKANVARLAERSGEPNQGARLQALRSELHRESRLLERKLGELQKGILEVRMVPLGQTFDKLERMIRRMAHSAGKEVGLNITGAEVQLDKLILEALSDPLIHLLRNAIDHGIEAPEAREQQGKSRQGLVSIKAMQQGNQVVIEISDDGRGLDPERIRQVALEKGLLSLEQAARFSIAELQSLIFLPGFSTASQVSELSGRGVGLDVAKTNIGQLSGTIETRSQIGKGTTFTITLPETLAVIRALVVSVSGRTYALPANAVLEIATIEQSEVRTVERREVIRVGGRTIPFARLSRLLGLPSQPRARQHVLVVGRPHRRLAVAVDELLGHHDVVIKPLRGRLRQIPGIAGATDLGDQSPVLVLDMGSIAEEDINPESRAEVL